MTENGSTPPSTPAPTPPSSIEGPGKGKSFFDRAKTVANTGNYDYAIDMFIEGLNREPENIEEHKALRETSLRRKVAGGKPAGGILGPKLPYKGKVAKEAMLNAEFVLAKDAGNIPSMMAIVRNALAADYREVINWMGPIAREANRTNKTPKFEIYIELKDIFVKIEEYKLALNAIQCAMSLRPNDMALDAESKNIAAMETMKKGKYGDKNATFKQSIKDKEQTKQLMEEENLNRSEEYRLKAVETAKVDYDANPTEVQVIAKYSKALQEMDNEQHENLAIEILTKAYAETQVYRFKVDIGNIRIKQFRRNVATLTEAVKADPTNKELAEQRDKLKAERLAFELEEFAERVQHFPTDLNVRFEYGVRLYETHRYDESIVSFQQAQNHPRHRVAALHLLGRSFMAQNMIPEAVDTLKKAIDEYDLAQSGDPKSKEFHYWYGRALEEAGNSSEAIEIYSRIIRWDIGYRDARTRLNALRGQA